MPMITLEDMLDLLFKAGSISGLIAIIYQIHRNRINRPRFEFAFEASHAEFFKKDKHEYCDYHFFGIFKNKSLNPNTITRLYLTVWENKKRSSVLRFGHGVKELEDIVAKKTYYLPLRFEAKQAFRLNVVFEFPITGTHDEKLIKSVEPIKSSPQFSLPKYRYEFLIEDINGNLFDYSNSMFSIKIINKWWTLGNYSKNPARYIRELFFIGIELIRWRWEIFMGQIGFYK